MLTCGELEGMMSKACGSDCWEGRRKWLPTWSLSMEVGSNVETDPRGSQRKQHRLDRGLQLLDTPACHTEGHTCSCFSVWDQNTWGATTQASYGSSHSVNPVCKLSHRRFSLHSGRPQLFCVRDSPSLL